MQGLTSTSRRRAFSQQALRRLEEVRNGRQSSTVNPRKSKALEIDGRSYLLPTLTLPKASTTEIKNSQLFNARASGPTPVVLDLQQVSSDGSPHSQSIKKHELRNEILQLQKAGYLPVGITNASEDVKKVAEALNLPYFISTRLHLQHKVEVTALDEAQIIIASNDALYDKEDRALSSVSTPKVAEQLPPMVVSRSVRSGQQIFAQNRSLVVLGNVSSGAEVLADEDVIVLGALKGRALAGIGGNVRARIMCQSFDAELISIAHCFTTCDDLDQIETGQLQLHKPTAISLQNDQLHFKSSAVEP
ncbi:putative cyclase-associated protein CAP/septum formation inhibitor MinC [Plasmopara halstedii]